MRFKNCLPLLCCLSLPVLLPACGDSNSDSGNPAGSGEQAETSQASSTQRLLAYERSAYFASLSEWAQAYKELDPLLQGADVRSEDWVRAATIQLQWGELGKATELLDRAKGTGADGLPARYLRARIASYDYQTLEAARDMYQSLLKDAPGDLATRYALARIFEDLDPEEESVWEANQERAKELYQHVLDKGLAHGGAWYVSALYRMYFLSLDDPDEEVRKSYADAWKSMESIGAEAVSTMVLNEGQLAKLAAPTQGSNPHIKITEKPHYQLRQTLPSSTPGVHGLLVRDLNGDRLADVAWLDEGGLLWNLQGPEGTFTPHRVWDETADHFRVADFSRDGLLDVLLIQDDRISLLDYDVAEGSETTPKLTKAPIFATLAGEANDLELGDFDHDGDLDLLAVGSFGLTLLRNDGAGRIPELDADQQRGGFADMTEELKLTVPKPLAWCAIEDFDSDQDLDFLVGGKNGTLLASSLRSGQFEDITQSVFGEEHAGEWKPCLEDFDGNGFVDILHRDASGFRLRLGNLPDVHKQFLASPAGPPVSGDFDLDGLADVIWPSKGEVASGFLGLGSEGTLPWKITGGPGWTRNLMTAEMDRNLNTPIALEILRLQENGLEIWHDPAPKNKGMRLRYEGKKDNPDGIGAVVEIRIGPLYRRLFYRGGNQILGLGKADYADVLRVTWPNGVVRTDLDIEAGDPFALDLTLGEQTEGLIGSCPFLYTWNGEEYVFISDVLGITPLGLPMGPGMLVPPDHDEYVLVRGNQLKPKDGFYELQFTEELREVTYLDRAELLVVDHPEGTEFEPNERFSFPPFPNPEPHLFDTPLVPTKAMGSDGKDWTAALAATDDEYAAPMEPLKGQFLGLSNMHWLELTFDKAETMEAERLRLVCTGWFYWTDASVNMATARTPGLEFVPPMILVPVQTDQGEVWEPIGPPVGFPAGKTKTMVIDLTGVLDRNDPRLRIQSSLTLYWDSLRLALGDRDGDQSVVRLNPSEAELWHRGFSAPIPTDREDQPERFDFETLTTKARWNQHPGMYTRHGDCLPLLQAIDDRYIIMGSGDALTLRFDGQNVPDIPEGYVRDYLVFLDGWAKDRDPNSVQALEVEPLPFHGMGSYPYPPEMSFPNDEAHRIWRKEWNTRPARRLMAPLAPAASSQWFASHDLPPLSPSKRKR
ncbi:MAG: FG-GAP-like repeat-containing protein [Planctomycetota bacterium]|nr:FG-GAP-like repeat-containing protein [Planctomycetota bacterium]